MSLKEDIIKERYHCFQIQIYLRDADDAEAILRLLSNNNPKLMNVELSGQGGEEGPGVWDEIDISKLKKVRKRKKK